jgi:hypothetical protein
MASVISRTSGSSSTTSTTRAKAGSMNSITKNPTDPIGLLFRFDIVYSLLRRNIQRFRAILFFSVGSYGTNRFAHRFASMARTSKTGKGAIPEPSFVFFLRAMGVMVLLVVIMATYFSVHT